MKKSIAVLFLLPLMLIACGEQKTDSTLNGMWRGESKSSKINLKTGEAAAADIIVYKFDNQKIETYRAKDNGELNDQVEATLGTYEKNDDTLTFNTDMHSCAKIDLKYPKSKKMTYQVAADLKTLKLSSGLKSLILTKLEEADASSLTKALLKAETGCFSDADGNPASFKPSPVEKP